MYRVELSREAEATYRRLHDRDRILFERMRAALEDLGKNPWLGKGLRGRLKGDRAFRVGAYRILYTLIRERLVVYVLDIGHRREVYR